MWGEMWGAYDETKIIQILQILIAIVGGRGDIRDLNGGAATSLPYVAVEPSG
jgi:hypothetical protein